VGGGRELAGGVVLRRPEAGDEPGYAALLFAPAVARWLRPEPLAPMTDGEVAGMLSDDMRHWREAGFGPWALVRPADGDGAEELVGRVGLRRTSIGGELCVELAWTVLPEWWGQGLASGAAIEAAALGRELGIDEVVALILPANAASRGVAARVGMEEAGIVEHAGLPHLLYRLAL
jgi:RimJ/RimL family protein N-acetyltransferase